MGKNTYIVLIVILMAILGFWYYSGQQSANDSENTNQEQMTEDNTGAMDQEDDSMMEEEDNVENDSMMEVGVEEFRVVGTNFKFSETELRVKKGDTVRIVFVNEGGFHDWVIDEFNAATKQIQEGNQETIEFVADQTGEFEYYCSVGQHREMGMVGTLIVE